jgi:hypothetical protein
MLGNAAGARAQLPNFGNGEQCDIFLSAWRTTSTPLPESIGIVDELIAWGMLSKEVLLPRTPWRVTRRRLSVASIVLLIGYPTAAGIGYLLPVPSSAEASPVAQACDSQTPANRHRGIVAVVAGYCFEKLEFDDPDVTCLCTLADPTDDETRVECSTIVSGLYVRANRKTRVFYQCLDADIGDDDGAGGDKSGR